MNKRFLPGENRDLDEYLAERIPYDVATLLGQPDAEFAEQVILADRTAVRAFLHEAEELRIHSKELTQAILHVITTAGAIRWVRRCI